MSHLPGKFVWFEHVSNDVARARAFYQPLFDWHVEAMPMAGQTYHMLMNLQDSIGGLRSTEPGLPPQWISYLSVDDVDMRYRVALAAGATELRPPMDFGSTGRAAAIIDPTGAPLYLWRARGDDRPDLDSVPTGDFCWNELLTPDADTALAFYERLIGYTSESMDLGPAGTYRLLKSGPIQRAGIMPAPTGAAPARWIPYIHVADCDRSAAEAGRLGATLLTPPTDIPGIGRFALLRDPLGATLAVFRGTSAAT